MFHQTRHLKLHRAYRPSFPRMHRLTYLPIFHLNLLRAYLLTSHLSCRLKRLRTYPLAYILMPPLKFNRTCLPISLRTRHLNFRQLYRPSYLQIPSNLPSYIPSNAPSELPSNIPTVVPSNMPSNFPSEPPSNLPSDVPSYIP